MTDEQTSTRRTSGRAVKIAFGLMALVSVALGLALWQLSARIGLPDATARILATAFIVAGIADALVLYFWDRLFPVRD